MYLLIFLVDMALGVHLVLMTVVLLRLWTGRHALERLVAADLIGVLTLSIIMLVALRTGMPLLADVALGVATVGFAATILLARFVAWSDPGAGAESAHAPGPNATDKRGSEADGGFEPRDRPAAQHDGAPTDAGKDGHADPA